MNEDNLPNATGEDAVTPSGSQPGMTTPGSSEDVNLPGASDTSREEVAWNDLKGNTQDRIKSLLRERDDANARAERLDTYVKTSTSTYQPPVNSQPSNLNSPEVLNARKVLSDIGFPTEDKVDQKISQGLGQIIYNFELEKLETKYDGDNGLPKFDRSEYQDFINKNPKYQAYDPEDVYKHHMYPEEVQEAQTRPEARRQSTTPSLRPNKTTVREEQWSPDWIENRLKQSDGLEWYSKNKEKVNNFLSSTQRS